MPYRETLAFNDILLVPRYSTLNSRSEADPSSFGYDLPIMTSPMDLITTPKMVSFFLKNNLCCCIHRYFKTVQDQLAFIEECRNQAILDDNTGGVKFLLNVYICVGTIRKYADWIDYLYDHGVKNFLVDLAHGDTSLSVNTIKHIKMKPGTKVIAGNIATKSAFERLQDAGADGIRGGVGPGSICSTRTATAFGVPLLTTLSDCANVKNDNVMLIADGGISCIGDIVKSMAVGADMCMLGRMLSGTNLAGGDCYDKNKELTFEDGQVAYKEYYGMASKKARIGVMPYSSCEGTAGLSKFTGSTEELVKDIKLNLQAALSYNGSKTWASFKKTVKIIRITPGGWSESLTHIESY